MSCLTECTVESATLAWLEAIGWSVAYGPDIALGTAAAGRRDYGEVVLEKRLLDALRTNNREPMKYNPANYHRRSIRLKEYDYSQPGAYFVTICIKDRLCLFGEVVDGEMRLKDAGCTAHQCWTDIPNHFPHVELDAFIIMPNHVHGILVIAHHAAPDDVGARHVGARHAVPLQPMVSDVPDVEQFGKPVHGSIPTIVRSFKSATTKRINALRNTPGAPVWQRNYYEHIIRSEDSLNRLRQYIADNPARWAFDRENPEAATPGQENQWQP